VIAAAGRVTTAPPEVPVEALRQLLHAADSELAAAALPAAVHWDGAGALRPEIQATIAALLPHLADTHLPEPRRLLAIESLIGAHAASEKIWPALREFLVSPASDNLKRRTVAALGETNDPQAAALLVDSFDHLPSSAQAIAFDALLARPEWTSVFLDAAEKEKLKLSTLGPANLFRLRTHPNKEIAQRASALINRLMRPNADKEKLIAELAPIVSQPGNAARGQELFTATCAVCHKLGDIGKEIGPVLTGIGAHGPEQLLVSIVDPNRQIDAGYETFNVETKDGQLQAGLLAQENEARIVLRTPTGDLEIPKANIKSSVNTHRSLMPEGFEALGGEALRDILTFVCGSESRFRVLDLSQAFTADTRRGLYQSQDHLNDTLRFKKFGIVTVDGIPFNLTNPGSSALGGNLIVLRGGGAGSFAHTLPERVEIPVNLPARAFHFLGGVAGWGATKPEPNGRPVMTVTALFADGQSEKTTLHNGAEFADYVRPIDVPGSRFAEGVVTDKQIRWFTVPVKHAGVVKKLILESPGNGPAATTAAITADLSAGPTPAGSAQR
jgi:putative heme-binding domain-containing protein